MMAWRNLGVCLALGMAVGPVAAEPVDVGKTEFAQSCAACHGETGQGDGYLASRLAVSPPDLTSIARRNGGVFPASDVYGMIMNGTTAGTVHLTGQMPVWGARYSEEIARSLGEDPMDLGIGSETQLHARIAALVSYVARLQGPGDSSLPAQIEVFLTQVPDVLRIDPGYLEVVVIAPEGFQAEAAVLSIFVKIDGVAQPGSGDYNLVPVLHRDLVGGQSQVSFAVLPADRASLMQFFGSQALIAEMEESIHGDKGSQPKTGPHHEFGLNYGASFCRIDPSGPADEDGFASLHLRDHATGKKYGELTLPVGVSLMAKTTCP